MSNAAALSPQPTPDSLSIGIPEDDRKDVSDALSAILSDTYHLLIKTHIYHWNVVGPLFHSIHVLLEEQYNDLFAATDVIAERIRALGFLAPVGMKAPASGLDDTDAKKGSAKAMVEDLIEAHEEIVRKMRDAAEKAAEKSDMVSEDMLVGRLTVHEKTLWMLRAIVAD
ncbi:MAG: DNA starvation/stationary phase protection protein [Pseudomonadota bacterium]